MVCRRQLLHFVHHLWLSGSPVHPQLGDVSPWDRAQSTQRVPWCWLSWWGVCECTHVCVCGGGGDSVALVQPHHYAGLMSLGLGGTFTGIRVLSWDTFNIFPNRRRGVRHWRGGGQLCGDLASVGAGRWGGRDINTGCSRPGSLMVSEKLWLYGLSSVCRLQTGRMTVGASCLLGRTLPPGRLVTRP